MEMAAIYPGGLRNIFGVSQRAPTKNPYEQQLYVSTVGDDPGHTYEKSNGTFVLLPVFFCCATAGIRVRYFLSHGIPCVLHAEITMVYGVFVWLP